MNRQAYRWTKVLLMGFALGLTFVFINLSLWTLLDLRETGKGRRSAPFKLSNDSTRRELSGVIGSQLSAFRKNDFPGAYKFAAENIRSQMNTSGFEHMVKTGYSAIAHSRDAAFGVILDNGDEAVVDVAVKDDTGRAAHFRYVLLHESAGWKIGGVSRVRMTGIAI
jgi:hypothetical protein